MDIDITEAEKWKLLRIQTCQNMGLSNSWLEAIELFRNRIQRKYFDPVEKIIKTRLGKGEGFTILTVECALIEMLAALKSGKVYNLSANAQSPSYEYKGSKRLYCEFLLTDPIFENIFYKINGNTKIDNLPLSAEDFYKNVRCGLLHEAKTKMNWYINTTRKSIKSELIFAELKGTKKVVYRSILFYRLKFMLNNYLDQLTVNDDTFNEKRFMFGRKLDDLFEIYDSKATTIWWQREYL